VRELVRVTNDNWALEIPAFVPDQAAPTALAATCRTSKTELTITAITQADPAVVTSNGPRPE
jgi:hypothetical protein